MFLPGIKIGPRKGWKENLELSKSQYCEIWFSSDDPRQRYLEIFDYVGEHHIHSGLHFWGVLDGNIMPNIAYPEEKIWKPSLERMKDTIDLAQKHAFEYVNIHLGNAALEHIDMQPDGIYTSHIENSEVPEKHCQDTFEQNVLVLHEYAKKSNVRLIIETVPPMDPSFSRDNNGRLHPHKTHALSNMFLEQLAKKYQLQVNNDISHTLCEFGQTTNREDLWKYVLDRSTALLPYTALVHMTTLVEPFNGTDSHNGITNEDFSVNVFPNKQQVVELLKLFNTQQNIWVINEPMKDFVENYNQLVMLLKQING